VRRRLAEVREAAGAQAGDAALARMLASGDFDAGEYDRAMDAAFGDDYYQVARPGGPPDLQTPQFATADVSEQQLKFLSFSSL